jgi:hypothetical protein
MRFVNAGGRAALLVDDQVFDLEQLSGGAISSDPMTVIIDQWDAALAATPVAAGGVPLAPVALGLPVPAPRAVYAGPQLPGPRRRDRGHAAGHPRHLHQAPPASRAESIRSLPTVGGLANDWEAELTLVFADGGRKRRGGGRDGPHPRLHDRPDISERYTCSAPGQLSMGKSFDTFCPIGPAIVTLDEIPTPHDLAISCAVNGVTKQDARTDDLIFDVPALVAFISSVCTLRAGDLCLTGTPAGVGIARGEKLEPGDIIDTVIEGLGSLQNPCIAE